jgi:hypothetical protein
LVLIGTKHTVLGNPGEFHREVDKGLVKKLDATVVMSDLGRDIMASYGVDEGVGRIEVIGHGARKQIYSIDDMAHIKESWGLRPNVLTDVTPGLISPNKGIFDFSVPAYVMAAKRLSKTHPEISTRKIIRGACHSDFVYSNKAKKIVRPEFISFANKAGEVLNESGYKLNMGNPIFEGEVLSTVGKRTASAQHGVIVEYRFLSEREYSETLAGGDLMDVMNQKKQQVTSGQIVEGVSHGCDIAAGKFWHAIEMLTDIDQAANLGETLDLDHNLREGEIIYGEGGCLVDLGRGEKTTRQLSEVIYNSFVDQEGREARRARNALMSSEMGFDEKHRQYLELADDILNKRLEEV